MSITGLVREEDTLENLTAQRRKVVMQILQNGYKKVPGYITLITTKPPKSKEDKTVEFVNVRIPHLKNDISDMDSYQQSLKNGLKYYEEKISVSGIPDTKEKFAYALEKIYNGEDLNKLTGEERGYFTLQIWMTLASADKDFSEYGIVENIDDFIFYTPIHVFS